VGEEQFGKGKGYTSDLFSQLFLVLYLQKWNKLKNDKMCIKKKIKPTYSE
jgi:hypothetical protein